jgi:hypothetical protein
MTYVNNQMVVGYAVCVVIATLVLMVNILMTIRSYPYNKNNIFKRMRVHNGFDTIGQFDVSNL